jgi:L-2,4-diaminobutyrate decarboxylase
MSKPATTPDLEPSRRRIAAAYSPANLQSAGSELLKVVASHLERVESRETKVLNWKPPRPLIAEARAFLDNGERASAREVSSSEISSRIAEIVAATLARGQNLHSPHYVGHQVPAPLPLAALFDFVGSVTNQVMAIYEMGPWATAVEHAVVDAVGERIGFKPNQFSGLITSGGTLANLTGLLTARNVAIGNSWSTGLTGRHPAPVLVAHADAHYSVTRSAGILGLGTDQIVTAALDSRRRIDPNRLDESLRDLRSRGIPIVAVSATSCATPTGAFDPLVDIAEICRRHEVWLHVDAAHGGALAFSPRHKHLLDGIEQADSVVCDAHKMMFMPALCAMLFYRNPAHRLATFHQEAPYLFDPTAPELAEFDSGMVNMECTKRAAAFGVWGVWSLLGTQIFTDMVDVTTDLAQQFHVMLTAAEDFTPLHEPQCNIVAFRYLPPDLRGAPQELVDVVQPRLRRAVIESGEYYLVQSRIDGRPVLRTTMMNPLTTVDDLSGLLACLRRFGRQAIDASR